MIEKRRMLFGVVVSGMLAGFAWLVLRPHEPVYQHKPLSYWLDKAYESHCSEYPEQCPEAAEAVRAMGEAAVPALVRIIGTRDTTGRRIVASFGGEFPFLHLPLRYNQGDTAVWAVDVLGPRGAPALPALRDLLSDKDASVRCNAARALGGLGPSAADALPELIQVLTQSRGVGWQDRALRDAVCVALGEMGPAAAAALPHLAAATNTLAAELAIIKIKGASFLPFMERLKDMSDTGRWVAAAKLVGSLGTNAEPAIPFLLSGLNRTNRSLVQPRVTMQEAALSALGALHRRPDLCLPAMIALLDSTEPNVRYQTLRALRGFGADSRPAVPAIVRCINNSRNWLWVQHEGLNFLKTLDPEAAAQIRLRPLR